MREVEVKAGERTKIIGLARHICSEKIVFEAASLDGALPDGIVEVSRSVFEIGYVVKSFPLAPLNTVEKKWPATTCAVHITTETDTRIKFQTMHLRDTHIRWTWFIVAVGFLFVVALITAIRAVR